MSDPLTGAAYRAVHRISDVADTTLADIGATCEAVPADALEWLLATGAIVPVADDPPVPESQA